MLFHTLSSWIELHRATPCLSGWQIYARNIGAITWAAFFEQITFLYAGRSSVYRRLLFTYCCVNGKFRQAWSYKPGGCDTAVQCRRIVTAARLASLNPGIGSVQGFTPHPRPRAWMWSLKEVVERWRMLFDGHVIVKWYQAGQLRDAATSDLAITALTMAIQQRHPKPGLICDTDQGVQYASGHTALSCKPIAFEPA